MTLSPLLPVLPYVAFGLTTLSTISMASNKAIAQGPEVAMPHKALNSKISAQMAMSPTPTSEERKPQPAKEDKKTDRPRAPSNRS